MTKCVRDLLDDIRHYHVMLSDRYGEIANDPQQNEKVSALMTYLSICESKQALMLSRQMDLSSHKNVLETWIKEGPEEITRQLFEQVNFQLPSKQYDVSTLLNTCSSQYQTVEDIYEQLSEIRPVQSSKEYFASLRTLENQVLREKILQILEYDTV